MFVFITFYFYLFPKKQKNYEASWVFIMCVKWECYIKNSTRMTSGYRYDQSI